MRTALPFAAAMLVAAALSFFLSIAEDGAPLWAQINPVETCKILAFGLSWGLGVPEALAVPLAILLFMIPPALAFVTVRWLLRRRGASRRQA